VACFSVAGAGGALLMMVAHGLSVALLFMLSTCIYHRSQTFDMSAMGGLATKAPVLAAFFVAATMASIGLPGFGNFWGEFTIFVALAETDLTRWLVAPAALGIIISAIYGLRAVGNIFFGQPKAEFAERHGSGLIEDLKGYEKLPASILIAGLVLTGIFPRFFSDDADRELSQLYPNEESHLPVHEKAAPTETTVHEEDSH
jgi:NADH-quinone oxidoreductase subunit M